MFNLDEFHLDLMTYLACACDDIHLGSRDLLAKCINQVSYLPNTASTA